MAKTKKTSEKETIEVRLERLNALHARTVALVKKLNKVLKGKAEVDEDDVAEAIKLATAYGNRLGRAIARNETTLENVED
jgi:hemerythrin-like domain-containing protein